MDNDEMGESSSADRPLKKAKYVWQVKGKYHLRAEPQPPPPPPACKGQCIDTFLARTERILDSDDEEPARAPAVPLSLVAPAPRTSAHALRRWQARQVARGYIDNTINSVLETWATIQPFDAEDFIEQCASGGRVEDEGILMAIQAHGLMAPEAPLERPDDTLDTGAVKEGCGLGGAGEMDLLNAAIMAAIEKNGLSHQN